MSGGSIVYQDVFRRADKIDDGLLSPEEFYEQFGDGIVGLADLQRIFEHVDVDRNGRVDIEELTAFFTSGGDAFHGLFGDVERINATAVRCLGVVKHEYETGGSLAQFRLRLFLREAAHQLHALASTLQAAHNQLVDMATPDERRRNVAKRLAGDYIASSSHFDAAARSEPRPRARDSARAAETAAAVESEVASALDAMRGELSMMREEVRELGRRGAYRGDDVETEEESDDGDDEDEDEAAGDERRDAGDLAAMNEHVGKTRVLPTPKGNGAASDDEDYGEDDEDYGEDYGEDEDAEMLDAASLLAVIAEASRRGYLPTRGRQYLKQALLAGTLSGRARRALARFNESQDPDALVDAMTL